MAHYASVDLGGGTYAYKKKFLKMIDNRHAYYMPDFGGMCDGPYSEVDADHHVYIKVEDVKVLNRVIEVLLRRYKFTPIFHWRSPEDKPYEYLNKEDQRMYKDLEYGREDYIGSEHYAGAGQEEETLG